MTKPILLHTTFANLPLNTHFRYGFDAEDGIVFKKIAPDRAKALEDLRPFSLVHYMSPNEIVSEVRGSVRIEPH